MNLYKTYIKKINEVAGFSLSSATRTGMRVKESVINPKKDAKDSRDLRKDEKSLTAFINKNYQKIMNLCGNKNKLKDFFINNFKKINISDKKEQEILNNLDNMVSQKQLQFYLTNMLLKGSGQGVRENRINENLNDAIIWIYTKHI